MKLVVFGASGHIGRAIVAQAVQRGHTVTAVVRDLARAGAIGAFGAGVSVVTGDIGNPASYVAALRGADAVIASISARRDNNPQDIPAHAATLLGASAQTGVARLAWVGGAAVWKPRPACACWTLRTFPPPGRPRPNRRPRRSRSFAHPRPT